MTLLRLFNVSDRMRLGKSTIYKVKTSAVPRCSSNATASARRAPSCARPGPPSGQVEPSARALPQANPGGFTTKCGPYHGPSHDLQAACGGNHRKVPECVRDAGKEKAP